MEHILIVSQIDLNVRKSNCNSYEAIWEQPSQFCFSRMLRREVVYPAKRYKEFGSIRGKTSQPELAYALSSVKNKIWLKVPGLKNMDEQQLPLLVLKGLQQD